MKQNIHYALLNTLNAIGLAWWFRTSHDHN